MTPDTPFASMTLSSAYEPCVTGEGAIVSKNSGRIIIDLFTTLDGVAQAPGARDEDPSGGFRFGGWQAGLPSMSVGQQVVEGMSTLDALLLGRRTYDIFAAYWPHHTEGLEGPIGQLFNRVPKYVATRNPDFSPMWQGTSRVGVDLASEVADIRQRHEDVHVIGSLDFVHTLFAEGLFDEVKLWVYPIVLGRGKRVFDGGAAPTTLRLLRPAVSDDSGVTLLHYARTGETPAVGRMGEA